MLNGKLKKMVLSSLVLGATLFGATAAFADAQAPDTMRAPGPGDYAAYLLNVQNGINDTMVFAGKALGTGDAAQSKDALTKSDEALGLILTDTSRVIPPDGWDNEHHDAVRVTQYFRLAVENMLNFINTGDRSYLDLASYDTNMGLKYKARMQKDLPKAQG